MPLATTGESTVLNALLAARFVSLHTANPGNTGASEVAGGSYARQAATFANTGNNPTVASNTGIIQYPTATAPWGTVTHFGLWSAASGGSFLGYNSVTTPKSIDTDDIARWEIGKLTVTTD
jgi:hypothetical protein